MTILIGHVDPRVKKNLSLGLDENSGLVTQWLTMMTMTIVTKRVLIFMMSNTLMVRST